MYRFLFTLFSNSTTITVVLGYITASRTDKMSMTTGSDRGEPLDVVKDAWVLQLMNHHVGRTDMNKLIMNYLVTGQFHNLIFES